MRVRRAEPGDAGPIEQLYRLLVPGDSNIRVAPERVAALMTGDNHLVVAEAQGAIVGTAFLTVCLDAMYGFQPYGLLENVVVAPAARGNGTGRALLADLEQRARALACTKLMLLSSATRTEAHAFFSALGFDAGRKRGFVKYLNR